MFGGVHDNVLATRFFREYYNLWLIDEKKLTNQHKKIFQIT